MDQKMAAAQADVNEPNEGHELSQDTLREASVISPPPRIHPLLLPFDTVAEEAFSALYLRQHTRGVFIFSLCGIAFALLFFARVISGLRWMGSDGRDGQPGATHEINLGANAALLLGSLTCAWWTGMVVQPPASLGRISPRGVIAFATFGVCAVSLSTCAIILFQDDVSSSGSFEWALIVGQILCTFPFSLALLLGSPFWFCTAMQVAGFICCVCSQHTGGQCTANETVFTLCSPVYSRCVCATWFLVLSHKNTHAAPCTPPLLRSGVLDTFRQC